MMELPSHANMPDMTWDTYFAGVPTWMRVSSPNTPTFPERKRPASGMSPHHHPMHLEQVID